MDAATSPAAPASTPQGRTVEPASRAAVAIARFQTPPESPEERFELRDPFAEVTYHAKSLTDMVAKAEQLGSTRFTAIAANGTRTPVLKNGNEWQRGAQLGPRPERPLDPGPAKDDVSAQAAEAPDNSAKQTTRLDQVDAKAIAKIDAQADRTALVARLEEALKDRYVIKRAPVTLGAVSIGHTEYRFRGDTSRVAFTESTFKLATDTNSPSVARSMVDVAQSRNWKGLRVSGSEDFRRLVWLEATVRGVKAVGYEPDVGDLDVLRREQQARMTNRIEPTRDTSSSTASAPAEKSSARGGGRKAVVAAIEAVLISKGVPEAKRGAVLTAATEKLAERASRGQAPKVKVYNRTAAPQRSVAPPTAEVTRSRDRGAPAHAR
ncbi:LPD7 domain-containing protein [Roseateles sp. NT4]|uniref:LPD7 domain-containing protein n=1 Tax=Roseateles sp. NT4 TaxID=3453715 RepID=UPI003EEE0AF5